MYCENILALHGPVDVTFQTHPSVQGKGKGKVHNRTDHDDLEGREVYLCSFFNLVTRWGGGWTVSATLRPLYSEQETRYTLYRRLGGPQSRSGRVRKISRSPGFDSRTVQPVANRYTD